VIPLIVGGYPHDRAGAVFNQHEVRDPYGNLLSGERIQRRAPGVEPFLLDFPGHARGAVLRLEPAEVCREAAIRPLAVRFFFRPLLDEGMLGGQQDEVGTVDRVDAGGKDFDLAGVRRSALGARSTSELKSNASPL
jgi:hypothetical protein